MTLRAKYPIHDPRGRHKAIAYDDQTTITYRCPCGRSYKIDHGKGKVTKRIGVDGCALLYNHWKNGVTAKPCRHCVRLFLAHNELPPRTEALA